MHVNPTKRSKIEFIKINKLIRTATQKIGLPKIKFRRKKIISGGINVLFTATEDSVGQATAVGTRI